MQFYYSREPRLFVDTGAIVALTDPSDKYHQKALQFRDQIIIERRIRLLTCQPILIETIENLLRKVRAGKVSEQRLSRVWKDFNERETMEVLDPTEVDLSLAWEILRKYKDQKYSLTDSIALAIVQRLRIENIFAFEKRLGNFSYAIGYNQAIRVTVYPY